MTVEERIELAFLAGWAERAVAVTPANPHDAWEEYKSTHDVGDGR